MRETKFWTWHMFAGVAILLLLGFHMVYTHMGELTGLMVTNPQEDGISIANSQARDAKLIFPVFFIVLLGIALYHGLYGLRNILFELCPHRGGQRIMAVLLLAVGICLFLLGSGAAIKAHKNALGAGTTQAAVHAVGR